MPELPEVETYRRYLEQTSLRQTIEAIDVEDYKLLTTPYDSLTEQLVGRSFVGTRRVGKNLFIFTDDTTILRMHFGMTGDLAYYHASIERPRHARIVFHFKSGFNLGFICPRKFERIGLVSSVEAFLATKKIAPDGLEITMDQLAKNLQKRKSPIKSVLLDQSTVAGLGNWIVDEVLFQAKVHPEQMSNQLSESEVNAVHSAIGLVLRTAINHEANYAQFPTSFLIHSREWSASPYTDQPTRHLQCPCGLVAVAHSRVGGRATYFCPKCQINEGK